MRVTKKTSQVRSLLRLSVVSLLFLVAAVVATGAQQAPGGQVPDQQAAGSISGTIVDLTGAVVVGAQVHLTREDQSPSEEKLTDDLGQFSFANVLGGVVFVSGIRRKEKECSTMLGAIELGGLAEMRPVIMACAAAGLGLLPAAVSSGIGVQAQQPLARVVVGGMITSPFAILFLIPVLASYWLQQTPSTDLTEK